MDLQIRKNSKLKRLALDIRDKANATMLADKSKTAVLLCEGLESSVDVALYSAVFPSFIVIPSNGCSDIIHLMPFLRKYCDFPTYGIIDRDNASKQRIRFLERTEGIYCTKLPFIENIICCPEVLKILVPKYGKDYNEVLKEVRSNLASILVDKMSLLNPFNIALPKDKQVEFISISIVTKSEVVHKTINLSNIMYTFRDKSIVGKVADAMGLHGKESYYKLIKKELLGNHSAQLISIMSRYLPKI